MKYRHIGLKINIYVQNESYATPICLSTRTLKSSDDTLQSSTDLYNVSCSLPSI